MIINMEIRDVLPDGTITEISYNIPLTVSLTVKRSYPDEPFTIVKCEVQGKDERELTDAICMIASKMKEMDLELLIPVVNNQDKELNH